MDGGNPLRLEVLGSSGAAAVVVSALYFLGAIASVASWVYTGFTFYDVLLISCVCAVLSLPRIPSRRSVNCALSACSALMRLHLGSM